VVAHDTGTVDTLVLTINIGTFDRRGDRAVPCPDPQTRLLPDLVTDGFGQGRLRVYMSHAP